MSGIERNVKAASRLRPAGAAVLATLAVALLAGCAKRDSITVGSVPDDYRTNHPIVIAEKQEVIDLPVGASDRGITRAQKESVAGFLASYDRSAAPVVEVLVPSNAANDVAATHMSRDLVPFLRRSGVPEGRIVVSSYDAGAPDVSAPVRVSYSGMRAQTGKCGRWPEDILQTSENKHYANFGCASQANLAAQIANPNDLLGPRKQTEIDAARRGVAIETYQNRDSDWTQEVEYSE